MTDAKSYDWAKKHNDKADTGEWHHALKTVSNNFADSFSAVVFVKAPIKYI